MEPRSRRAGKEESVSVSPVLPGEQSCVLALSSFRLICREETGKPSPGFVPWQTIPQKPPTFHCFQTAGVHIICLVDLLSALCIYHVPLLPPLPPRGVLHREPAPILGQIDRIGNASSIQAYTPFLCECSMPDPSGLTTCMRIGKSLFLNSHSEPHGPLGKSWVLGVVELGPKTLTFPVSVSPTETFSSITVLEAAVTGLQSCCVPFQHTSILDGFPFLIS